jgi:hypothetical protein
MFSKYLAVYPVEEVYRGSLYIDSKNTIKMKNKQIFRMTCADTLLLESTPYKTDKTLNILIDLMTFKRARFELPK